ncbi:hypothetical protein ABVT39_006197 [Epinephelus coioides]
MADDVGERLNTEVQKNPPVYDKSERLHKDATKKMDNWDAIRRTLGISGLRRQLVDFWNESMLTQRQARNLISNSPSVFLLLPPQLATDNLPNDPRERSLEECALTFAAGSDRHKPSC